MLPTKPVADGKDTFKIDCVSYVKMQKKIKNSNSK